jgi:hypothetical protein
MTNEFPDDEAGFGPFVIRASSFAEDLASKPSIVWATAMERSHVPVREESRHSQMQRMAAMISATQLTPIGIW